MTASNPKSETAVFAAGCFWGVQELIRGIPGVEKTEVGYCGGQAERAKYEYVKTGQTGHAEALRVVFNPAQLSFAHLLDSFFRLHDPTTLNRQGNDIGTQYRSVIFWQTEEQRKVAEEKKREVDSSGKWKKPVVTQIVPAEPFYSAESYHQDYLVKKSEWVYVPLLSRLK